MPSLMVVCAALLPMFESAATAGNCSSDIDCQLNGICTKGACSCDRPWTGDHCGLLEFREVTMPQGYGMTPNHTTWGGNILHVEGSKKYHMYVSAMTNDCGLGHW